MKFTEQSDFNVFEMNERGLDFHVNRKAVWVTPGLPVELGVEKLLGITNEDIGTKISIEDYNARCRKNVMMFTQEWTELSELIGYWVDKEQPYIA